MSDLNDPRVLFAAERTLLAWNRTSLALMAFGFVIERFGLFVSILIKHEMVLRHGVSFWTGMAFVLLGAAVAAYSAVQYRKVLTTLKPVEIPEGYRVNSGVFTNLAVSLLGIVLTIYFFLGV